MEKGLRTQLMDGKRLSADELLDFDSRSVVKFMKHST